MCWKALKWEPTTTLPTFQYGRLILRIEAILRRTTQESSSNSQQVFTIGRYTFDTRKQTLLAGENTVKLTTKESELLKLLCQNANKVLERNYALKSIWIDDNYFNARSMDVYITKLRKHLKDEPSVEIINVHGKGYKLII
jgi:DNA-binding response OmpR family regulator